MIARKQNRPPGQAQSANGTETQSRHGDQDQTNSQEEKWGAGSRGNPPRRIYGLPDIAGVEERIEHEFRIG